MRAEAEDVFGAEAAFAPTDSERERVVGAYFSPADLRGRRVLDAGCHAGGYAAVFSRLGAVPYGVDLEAGAIEKAKRDHPGFSDHFHQASVCSLGMFPDAFFDVVFCFGVMPYLDPAQTRAALAEFRRVTRPGGKMLLVFQKDKSAPLRAATRLLNLLPLRLYRALAPVFAAAALPAAPLLIGRRVTFAFMRDGVFMSLRGIHFGVPPGLEAFTVPTPDCGAVSAATSVSCLVPR